MLIESIFLFKKLNIAKKMMTIEINDNFLNLLIFKAISKTNKNTLVNFKESFFKRRLLKNKTKMNRVIKKINSDKHENFK